MEHPKMRYDPQDRYYSKNAVDKRLRKPRRAKPGSGKVSYLSVEGTVTSKPRSECTIFQKRPRKNQSVDDFRRFNREEVTVTAVLHLGSATASYVIRFVHSRCIDLARRLTPGTRIRIETGFFNYRPGRSQSEFWVKRFHLLDATEQIRTKAIETHNELSLTMRFRNQRWVVAV
jgi:hypothetical protein